MEKTIADHLARLDEIESLKAAQNYQRKMPDYSAVYREMHRQMRELDATYGPCGPNGWEVTP